MSGVGGGFAGMTGGSFFAAPGWIDKSKPPGRTAQVLLLLPDAVSLPPAGLILLFILMPAQLSSSLFSSPGRF